MSHAGAHESVVYLAKLLELPRVIAQDCVYTQLTKRLICETIATRFCHVDFAILPIETIFFGLKPGGVSPRGDVRTQTTGTAT